MKTKFSILNTHKWSALLLVLISGMVIGASKEAGTSGTVNKSSSINTKVKRNLPPLKLKYKVINGNFYIRRCSYPPKVWLNGSYLSASRLTLKRNRRGYVYQIRLNPSVITIELHPEIPANKCKGTWTPGGMLLVMGKGVYEVNNKNFTFKADSN